MVWRISPEPFFSITRNSSKLLFRGWWNAILKIPMRNLIRPLVLLKKIERGVLWRSHALGLPYGDQALFMRADTFAEMGGFREMPLMEDYEMLCRLRRRGRIAIAPAKVMTSARRWLRLGMWRTTLLNQIIVAGYVLGVSSVRLARLYYAAGEDTDGKERVS